MKEYDIVVVGQGIVGAAAALGFSKRGYSVAIVDPLASASWSADEYDNRVFAVSPASVRLLNELDVWEQISSARVSPYRHMKVWDEGSVGSLSLSADEAGVEQLGFIVENSLLCTSLATALAGLDKYSDSVSSVDCDGDEQPLVTLSGGEVLRSKLLIAADGANSFIRKSLGIPSAKKSYAQRGLVANVSTGVPHRNTAWQRFLATGPLAFLPLADGRSSIVWSLDDASAERLEALSDDQFAKELALAADGAFGLIEKVERRASFPLSVSQAADYVKGRVVLVGDAAHTIHPLAGLGVNLGLGDVEELLLQLEDCDELNGISQRLLRRYQRIRRSENMKLAVATDSLNALFSSGSAGLSVIRGQGMKMVGRNPRIRGQIAAQAMGL